MRPWHKEVGWDGKAGQVYHYYRKGIRSRFEWRQGKKVTFGYVIIVEISTMHRSFCSEEPCVLEPEINPKGKCLRQVPKDSIECG